MLKKAGILLILIFFFFTGRALGDIYIYKDPETGEIIYSNIPLNREYKIFMKTEEREVEKYIEKYDYIFEKAGKKYGVDPALLKAIARVESNFNPWAISHKGAIGMMQIIPSTGKILKVSNLFSPVENIFAGARYLRKLIDMFGDLKLALAAYNAGPGAVKKYHGIPPYRETRKFIRFVLRYYRVYKKRESNINHNFF